MPGRIHVCGCANVFQDERYGPGKRVFTVNKDGTGGTCTVCGTKTSFTSSLYDSNGVRKPSKGSKK